MTLIVRGAVLADADVIVEFNRRLALETEDLVLDPDILKAGVAQVLADTSRGRYFVAQAGSDVVGQCMVTYEWSDWRNSWIWWLQSVYVRADHRGQGVFKQIFEALVEEARERHGVSLLRLYVERENHAAQATYQKLGFDEMHFHLFQRPITPG